jgi:SAM-dependent methyltransferase
VRLAGMAGYTAAEPDPTSWAVANERITPAGGTVINGDHTRIPAGRGYDLVCAFEVLEHLEDDAGALAQWLPLVRPGGHLLLSVPADPDRFGPWDEMVGHCRRYTADQLRALLVAVGGEEIEIVHYAWPLGAVLDAVRDRLAARRGPGGSTAEERTAGSGRVLQPTGRLAGGLVRAGVAPFVALQSLAPGRGTGLVACARRPAGQT